MANLRNIDKIWTVDAGVAVTVGHNRTVTRESNGIFVFRLHGHPIARVDTCGASGLCKIEFDTCGWNTTTTRAAMSDAMSLFGVSGTVSFAGGEFSARYKARGMYHDRTSSNGQTLKITAERYAT